MSFVARGTARPYQVNDEYDTPDYALDEMTDLLPRTMTRLWEAFPGPRFHSTQHMRDQGYTVWADPRREYDFFGVTAPPADVQAVVSNPPFSRKIDAVERLCEHGIPFVLLMPTASLQQVCFHKRVAQRWGHDLSVVFPGRKVRFLKDGELQGRPPFECAYLLYRIAPPPNPWLSQGE